MLPGIIAKDELPPSSFPVALHIEAPRSKLSAAKQAADSAPTDVKE